MPRFRRLVVPGYAHHVTQRGVRRQTTFFVQSDYRAYISLAAELLPKADLEIWAYCLMPNHVHAVVVPRAQEALSKFFAELHRRYARRTNALNEWRGHLWQERFYSVVLDETHALAAMRYVELNPVRSGLVNRAQEWPWSSARGNLDLLDDPLVSRIRTREMISDWRRYLGEWVDDAELQSIRMQTSTGRPAGNATFIAAIEAATGRCLRARKRGRKARD